MKFNFGPETLLGSSISEVLSPVTAGWVCLGQPPPALRISIESVKSTDSNKKRMNS